MDDRMDSLDAIRKMAPEVVTKMADMLGSPKVPAVVKVRIMEMILDRTYGRPEAAIKLTSAQQSVEEAQERIAAIVDEIELEDDE